MKRRLDEATMRIYETLLERFGEPITDPEAHIGVADEGPGGKATYEDDPESKEWSDPNVVHETRNIEKEKKLPALAHKFRGVQHGNYFWFNSGVQADRFAHEVRTTLGYEVSVVGERVEVFYMD